VLLIVLDSVGIGEMPDAAAYGDAGSDTLGNLLARRPATLPNLQQLGLGNIRALNGCPPAAHPSALHGKAAIASAGKDTTTGHWEMAGVVTTVAFPTYPRGFPRPLIAELERRIGTRVLGNVAASGTAIIAELGDEHVRTGCPIVYTSADSVFQVAAHEDVVPVERLYEICRLARALLDGDHRVGRVIARPFTGTSGAYTRTTRRMDFAVEPPEPTMLDILTAAGIDVIAVGKVGSIFCHRGITRERPAAGNEEAVEATISEAQGLERGLVFANLVDFDMLYGHRNDVEGYARALEAFDAELPRLLDCVGDRGLLVITADHGCDPTTPSTDHSREFVPVLAYRPGVEGRSLGVRASLADIGQTIATLFGLRLAAGTDFAGAFVQPH
jgi:phosphopentomutase